MLAHLRAAAAFRSMSPVEILLVALILGIVAMSLMSGLRHGRSESGVFVVADREAKGVVVASQAREAKSASEAWAQLAQAVWTKQCADKICYDQVAKLAGEMPKRAEVLAKQFPDESTLSITGMVGKEYGPKFKAAVDASKSRAAKAQGLEKLGFDPNIKLDLPK